VQSPTSAASCRTSPNRPTARTGTPSPPRSATSAPTSSTPSTTAATPNAASSASSAARPSYAAGAAPRPAHNTPARAELRRWATLGYPEALTAADIRAAYQPCGRCDQGGIENPSAGQSWECPGCRKDYDPGEYATAVRRDLLTGGPDRDGWTHVAMAAEAVTMMTGVTFGPDRIRRWMDRSQVAAVCRWRAERRGGVLVSVQNGLRLVLWTDVRDRAEESIRRAKELELERQHVARQEQQLRAAVAGGEDPASAGKRLDIHPARVARFLDKWDAEARLEARDARFRRAN
jgi:hypothetical protein